LNPNTTNNEPKQAIPKATLIVVFLPKLSDVNDEIKNPTNDPKYGELLMISKRY
jgi:hypothetical protein